MQTSPNKGKKIAIGALIGWLLIGMVGIIIGTSPVHGATSFTVAIGSDFTGQNAGPLGNVISLWSAKNPQLSIGIGDLAYGDVSVGSWCNNVWSPMIGSHDGILVVGTHDTMNRDRLTNSSVTSSKYWENATGYANTCGIQGSINWVGSGTPSNGVSCNTSTDYTNIYTCLGREGYFDYPTINPIARFIITCAGIPSNPNATFWCNYDTTGTQGPAAQGNLHLGWIDSTVNAAKQKGEWVIVLNHVENWNMFEGTQYSDDFWNHMITDKVDLVAMAGSHTYQRSYPLTCQKTDNAANWYQAPANSTTNTSCIANTSLTTYTKGQGVIYMNDGDVGQAFHNFCQFGPPDTDITGTSCTSSHYTDWNSNKGYMAASNDTTWGFNYLTVSSTALTSTYVNCTTCSYTYFGAPWSSIPTVDQNKFTDTFTINNPSSGPGTTGSNGGSYCKGVACPATTIGGFTLPVLTFPEIATVIAVLGVMGFLLIRRRAK